MGDKKNTIDPNDVDETLDTSTAVDNEQVDQELALQDVSAKDITNLYGGKYANIGTEEISQEDLNTPNLILMQTNTDIEGVKAGQYYRSDTKEMMESVDVNFVYVTTKELLNKKGEPYTAKIYFGFFAGTNEPFQMKMKGWGLATHRELQTEISVYKNKLKLPMFALTIRLSSERKEGLTKGGDEYKIEKPVCTIIKDEKSNLPVVANDPDRIAFLLEAAERFQRIAPVVADAEDGNATQSDRPF